MLPRTHVGHLGLGQEIPKPHPAFHQSIYPPIPPTHPPAHPHPPNHPPIHPATYPFILTSVHPPTDPPMYPLIRSPTYLLILASILPPTHLSPHPPLYPPTHSHFPSFNQFLIIFNYYKQRSSWKKCKSTKSTKTACQWNTLNVSSSLRIESRGYFTFGAVTAVLGVVTSSEVSRPDLHLGAFGGVVRAFPSVPVHAVSVRRVVTVVVQAVQVWVGAPPVPPGAFAPHGAAPPMVVVVSVFGAEGHRIVPRQWVTRCTCEEKMSNLHLE